MYILVRIIIFLVSLLLLVFVLGKQSNSKSRKPIRGIMAVVLATTVVILFSIYPVEDLFVSFSSPNKVFNYTGRGNVEHIIEGRNSSMVFGRLSNGELVYYVIPKDNGKWKIGSLEDLKMCQAITPYKGLSIIVYKYKKTEDYYIIIKDDDNTPKTIVNNYGELFFREKVGLVEGINTYFSYYYGFSSEAFIVIDGTQIRIP